MTKTPTLRVQPATITLAQHLEALGHCTQTLPADPSDHQLVDAINVWAPNRATDRYPVTTVLAPRDSTDTWTWGNHFEHTAPAISPVPDLAALISATCQLPRP